MARESVYRFLDRLAEGGVACLAGTAFGEHGRGYLRFSYANSVENIREGLQRLQAALLRYRARVS